MMTVGAGYLYTRPGRYRHRLYAFITMVGVIALFPAVFLNITQAAENQTLGRTIFTDELRQLVAEHNDIKAAEHDLRALELNLTILKKSRFPTLALSGGVGKEDQENPGATNVILDPKDLNVRLSLPIFNPSIAAATRQLNLSVEQGRLARSAAETSVLLQGISARIGLYAAKQASEYAEQSVDNIKQQTALENARVNYGSGLTSDLLQSKAQLAAANARRTLIQGVYQQALNRYVAVFGYIPTTEISLEDMALTSKSLPTDLLDALKIAAEESPQVYAQRLAFDISKEAVNAQRASTLIPSADFFVEVKYKKDFAGSTGFERDILAKVELAYNFNTAGSNFDNIKVAEQFREAAARRYDQSKIIIEEQVRNVWSQHELTKINSQFLRDQDNLASGFLQLARKEHALGQRTLLEVLAGETSQFNAASDAVAAEAQVLISAYSILASIGRLNFSVLAPGDAVRASGVDAEPAESRFSTAGGGDQLDDNLGAAVGHNLARYFALFE